MLFAVFKKCDTKSDLEAMDYLWLLNMFGCERVLGYWWFSGKIVDLKPKELQKKGYRLKKIKIGLIIDNNVYIKEIRTWVKKRRAYVDANILAKKWENEL